MRRPSATPDATASEGEAEQAAVAVPAALASRLRAAGRIAVLTGAGISAESGIQTFRDADGLWSRFDPEKVATRAAFRRDPAGVWSWYEERRRRMAEARPNAGHLALARMESLAARMTLVTQNIDGLHRAAGSRRVIELHGNIFRARCFDEDVVVDEPGAEAEGGGGQTPPRCPYCGGYVRPDVVWFGEMLPMAAFQEALASAQRCDVFLSVGTSGLVEPAASLPFEALRAGALVVEVNPEPTPLTAHAAFVLSEPAGAALPRLVRAAWPRDGAPPVTGSAS